MQIHYYRKIVSQKDTRKPVVARSSSVNVTILNFTVVICLLVDRALTTKMVQSYVSLISAWCNDKQIITFLGRELLMH